MRTSRPYAVTLLLVGAAALGACSPGGGDVGPSAQERLTAARRTLDASPSVRVDITSPDFPAAAQGVSAVEGVATHQPGFEGTLTVRGRGLQGTVDVVSVGGRLHLRMPFTRTFVQAEASDYDAPDPAGLLSPGTGISSMLTALQDPRLGEPRRDGTDVLQTVTGTIPGSTVVSVLATGDPAGRFPATVQLDDEDHVRSVRVQGPFFPGSPTATYDVRLDGYGEQVTVREP